jgi:DUF438 domain-containing protein
MSELINNSLERKKKLKELILKLHHGETQESVRRELLVSLSRIPYGEVVEVEQELISEGLPESEVLELCDAHSAVLNGHVDLSGMALVPEGHPVDVFTKENKELVKLTHQIEQLLVQVVYAGEDQLPELILKLRGAYNNLWDVDKHYQRKEYLLFPYLEREGITGPPKVMWGKHDEIRELLKGSMELLEATDMTKEELLASADIVLEPALRGVEDMTGKEDQILFPMALEKLTEADWYAINNQSLEIGFCLYDPPVDWKPEGIVLEESSVGTSDNHVRFPSGNFKTEELMALLNTLPVDITFVDRNDKVKYFSQSSERIFQRNRAILNRDVRYCHPPGSVHIVDKIIEDFKSGGQSRAPFWINMGEKFIHIEYFALRNEKGEYLGTLEISQDLTHYRALEGEQRILSYK